MILSQLPSLTEDDYRPLPTTARTRNGVEFNPSSDHWNYRDGAHSVNLNFSVIAEISPMMRHSLKGVLLWYAENLSPAFLISGFAHFKRFFKELFAQNGLVLEEVRSTDLINYRASLGKNKEWFLGYVAGFLKQWEGLRLPGVSSDAITFLSSIRLSGNPKGVAVLTMDPKQGPFTSIELEALHCALNDAYTKRELSLGDYLLAWLLMMLGQRPIQYAYLKVCDVLTISQDDAQTYILRIPRAKQLGTLPRSSFKERALTPQIGALLLAYSETVKAQFKHHLDDPNQAPLFPENLSGREYPPRLEFHQTGQHIGQRVKAIFAKLQVQSERTGQPLHISPTRFRRTLGTRAAAEGHGELVIAELLDHTDTQNVWVYVEATPEMVARIDRAMAVQLAPLAQAFSGIIIDEDPRQGGHPASNIFAPQYTQEFTPVGDCGKNGFCGFAAPIACYTCRKFHAWLDGPHEAVLDYLLAERQRLMVGTDPRIAAINDRTILAVAQVVQQCKSIRTAREQHGG
ncbi:site-specific integrase [Vogesella indigofera]|uniref:site-specific integrase n=1 Tax=Vogesella indigofera TaxID=45465 RepID=UPI00234F929B|nr:site-specific integrase [Vogesella indigofera]MDC7701625.1 site-specific integrase [Vogesella indigofera]